MASMKNSSTRYVIVAIVIFFCKLRTGNSSAVIASVFGFEWEQLILDICNSVTNSFEKDILPSNLGFFARNREDLITNETSIIATKLHNIENNLALIFDGTYIRHGKSSNNEYKRKSYSGQNKLPLCKPFTVCTTTG